MTVPTSTAKSGPYAGAGTTGPFTVGFRFLENSHLQVIRTSTLGLDSTLALTTDYSVTGAGGTSGSVTLVTALASGEKLTIIRNVPFTQDADYVQNDAFPAESHERALDKLTMEVQQVAEESGRALTLPATVSGVSTSLPTPQANSVLAWNPAANELQNITTGELATIVAYGTAASDIFTGTGSQVLFVLSSNPGALNNLDVAIGGVTQLPGVDYTWSSGTTVTFTTAPVLGAKVLIRYMQALALGTADAGSVQYTPAGTGAVATTVQAKLRESVSVKDFGAVADGTFVYGGSASGTDNLAAFNAALAAAVSTGISRVHAPGGRYYLSGKLTLPSGVILEGDGTAWLPGFLAGISKGTALLINGAAANDCLAFAENTAAHAELRDISIYNTNTNAIRSVVSVVGHLYPRMKNVEISSLRKTTGSGLYIAPSSIGAYETLWGDFDNVMVTITDVGIAGEASVRWGLNIYALASNKTINANCFRAGQFTGAWGGLLVDGAIAGAQPLSNVFHGTKFDTNWDGTFTPVFKSAAANVFGFTKANCYIYPVVRISKGNGIAFYGCYFEVAGAPATYNDGVNGSAPLVGVFWVDNATDCIRTGAYDSNFNGCYVFDAGAQSNIAPVTNGFKHNNQIGTALLLRQSTAQSIAAYAYTKIQFSNVLQGDDSNLEWDATNYQVKIRQPGVYQISAIVCFAGWATAGTYAVSRIVCGGFNFDGTFAPQIGAGNPITTTNTIAVSLVTGDTIETQVLQNQGSNQLLAANYSLLSVVKIA